MSWVCNQRQAHSGVSREDQELLVDQPFKELFFTEKAPVCLLHDPNPNNLVSSTTFYSESTQPMLCLVRIETDPPDKKQLRITVASGDPALTYDFSGTSTSVSTSSANKFTDSSLGSWGYACWFALTYRRYLLKIYVVHTCKNLFYNWASIYSSSQKGGKGKIQRKGWWDYG